MTPASLSAGLALSALTLLNATAFAQAPCKAAPTTIHVAAGALGDALSALSTQAGCPVQYDKKLVQPFHSHAVKGSMLAADALVSLVQGTGLEAHSTPGGLSVNQADQHTIGLKAAALQAQLGQAVKSQKIAQNTADAMYEKLAEVRTSVITLAKKQGFVSAGEKASYQRTFAQAEHLLAKNKPS